MATRWLLTTVTLCMTFAAPLALHADIYRWDNGQVIPGTEGITPGPGVQLGHMELEWARLGRWPGIDLTGASFESSNLTNAHLWQSTLTNANLSGATVTGADFSGTTSRGFTQEQLYSTASYQAKTLQGVGLGGNDLTGWDFSQQNLTNANLYSSTLTNADLAGAILTHASLGGSTLTNANLRGADLTNANLSGSTLADADLTDTVVAHADLSKTTSRGFTKEQLYSTASYKKRYLGSIGLEQNDLSGWNFSGQDLANATCGVLGWTARTWQTPTSNTRFSNLVR